MKILKKILKELPIFKTLIGSLNKKKTPIAISGLSDIHKAHFIYTIIEKSNSPALLIAHSEAFAQKISNDLEAFGLRTAIYPARDFNFYDVDGKSAEYEHRRLSTLYRIVNNDCDVVIACIDAALQFTIPKEKIKSNLFSLKLGQEIPIKKIVENLLKNGYERADQVEGVGQFSLRGGILDFFTPNSKFPIRIEFFGDEIDTMSHFDLSTQRRTENVSEVVIALAREVIIDNIEKLSEDMKNFALKLKNEKAKEAILSESQALIDTSTLGACDKFIPLIYPRPCTLFDYIDQEGIIFISEQKKVLERIEANEKQWQEDLKLYLEDGILCPGLDTFSEDKIYAFNQILEHNSVYLDIFSSKDYLTKISQNLNFTVTTLPIWNGSLKLLCEDINDIMNKDHTMIILAGTKKSSLSLLEDLKSQGFNAQSLDSIENINPGRIYISPGALSSGFSYPELKFSLITHGHFNKDKIKSHKKNKKAKSIYSLSDINPGDHIVHSTHGIGVFKGIHKIELQGIKKDYLKIAYAKNDVLYVPVTQLDTVDKYIGPKEDIKIKLNKLGSNDFQKSKNKVKKAVKDIAKELIKLYSERMKAQGHAFPPDNEWQKDFEAHFEYEETPDQLTCIDEIKNDMQKSAPMDRLLCGDVGFGKTEVALRAAFKCVSDSKQCAILVPTTILAWQHFNTAIKRFENSPVKIEILSRFRTPKQQEVILKRLKHGEIDLIIGTHRLVQKDILFRDLGLVIIDEEQRFGVTQKERFKSLCKNVDVLTLSATPIPRTLNMAMSGIRDMSIIEEAPQNRHPVQTYVLEHDDLVLNEAIRKELRRGGQVYYLHNNVSTISSTAYKIQKAIPEAKVSYAHGKMDEKELSSVWEKLLQGEINVLVCTTIIETGIDIPNINTLIIENADCMGLSQLHQIRGRVGRSSRRAFAYFTFKKEKSLSDISQKRLSAIREFTEFGSGFKIAMRDLELRGAGSLLGDSQHGHMADVGYDMYLKLLGHAISEEKGETIETSIIDCTMDLPIEAYIPEKYIVNLNQRIDVYRRISDIRSEDDASDVIDEIIDRYGNPPKSVNGLIEIALLRITAVSLNIYEIKQRNGEILLFQEKLNQNLITNLMNKFDKNLTIHASNKPYLAIKIDKKIPILKYLREIFNTAIKNS